MFSKKFSSNLRRRRRIFTSIIVIFALTLGLGYSAFSSNLNFLGSLSLNAKTLNVYVKSVTPTSGSVTPTSAATIVGNNRQEVDFSTSLPTLSDYYEVSTVIRNGGKNKAYYIGYDLTIYDSNGNEITLPSELEVTVLNNYGTNITKNHELNLQTEETFKIKLKYKSETSLPSTQPVYTIKVVFNYSLEPVIPKLYDVIKEESESGGLAAKYTGNHNDTLDNSGTEYIYYYTGDARDKINVKLGDMCWKMFRTTDTGGVKLLYNGAYDENNKCNESRETRKKGIISARYREDVNLAESYVYGDSYSYNPTTEEFMLENTSTATWSDSTADTLIGKYTCKTIGNTCTTLYGINGYSNNTTAVAISYTIGDVGDSIGSTPFNAFSYAPAMVGYMFNKVYNDDYETPASGTVYGNDVTYSGGQYTLTNTSTTKDDTHHYTCNNTSGTCSTVRYYYEGNYYIELTEGTKIEDAVNEMLYADNVNTKNSNIKALIEVWYRQNMTSYTNKLEDVVYCNDRSQSNADINGWNKNGSLSAYMQFKNSHSINELSCTNDTDKFTTTNTKAKLEYPVGLITSPEMNLLNNDNAIQARDDYWLGSPYSFFLMPYGRQVSTPGRLYYYYVDYSAGVRPSVSLKPSTKFIGGNGSMNCPYILDGDEVSIDPSCTKTNLSEECDEPEIPDDDTDLIDNYNKVEYIESDGSSYIDTGITLDSKYTFEAEGLVPSGKSGSFIDGFGSTSSRQGLLFNNTSSNRFAYYWFGVGNTFVNLADTGIDMSNRFKVVQNKNGVTLTQGENILSKTYSGTSGTSTATINLLRQVQNSYAGYTRLYNAKIKEGDTVLHNYVPVTRKSDGVIGVYDTKENKFFTNSGSGSFSKGNNIE